VVERLFVSVRVVPNLRRMLGLSHRMTLRAEVAMDERVCTGLSIGNVLTLNEHVRRSRAKAFNTDGSSSTMAIQPEAFAMRRTV
jgi:hypothetical protein